MNITSINSVQESTLKAYNKLIKDLNKADTETKECLAIVEAQQLKSNVRELHNCLVFLLGSIDPETGVSLWGKFPDAMIQSITWGEN